MAILNDYACKFCLGEYEAWSDSYSCRYCRGTGEKYYSRLTTDSWGGPRFIRSLQQTFESKSSLNKWLARHRMTQSPLADKHGGAYLGEAPRLQDKIYFDPKPTTSRHSRAKGTWARVDPERK